MSHWLTGSLYGVCIFVLMMCIYLYWVFFIFRYNIDRIGNLILVKYGALHQSLLNPNGTNYLNYADVVITGDSVSCKMQVKDKVTQTVQSEEPVTYTITTDASKCTLEDALEQCVVI